VGCLPYQFSDRSVLTSEQAISLIIDDGYLVIILTEDNPPHQTIVIGLCFCSALSPIAGTYGWFWGAVAAILHFFLVRCVPDLHGGFLLYNGGFTACLVCVTFIPVLEHFCKTKAERQEAKKN
jgi:hypothetical protein